MKKKTIIDAGRFKKEFEKTIKKISGENLVKRIWEKDASVWMDGQEYRELINNRLGWLTLPASMKANTNEINSFTEEIRNDGFKYSVLMGMGGSSMFPEVCIETFGISEGYPRMHVLDSTDPMTVFETENSVDIDNTLFIVASKSGGTIEVDSFFRFFYDIISQRKGNDAGKQFIAITDPGTQLESLAKEKNFRKIFTNPADIGGRYSALSYFGLVPAALIGVDIKKLLNNAEDMMDDCMLENVKKNPGILAGALAGTACLNGADKLTFDLSQEIRSFGYWVEQLIAESTGKEGKGILPIEGEDSAKKYGKDRIFASIYLGKKNKKLKLSKKTPHMIFQIKDIYEMGGQFFLWEFATAVMGSLLGINPFDEPNVKESKDNTGNVLKYYEENKSLPEQVPQAMKQDLKIYHEGSAAKSKDAEDIMKKFLKQIKKGNYFSIMAYITRNKKTGKQLQKIRDLIMKDKQVATTVGYGPRFLHSTGQYHKGGPDEGVFMQIVSEDTKDLDIPGKPYSFGTLKQAQATGDYESLVRHKRKVIRIDAGRNTEKGLRELYKIIKKSI